MGLLCVPVQVAKIYNLHEAKTQLSRRVRLLLASEEVDDERRDGPFDERAAAVAAPAQVWSAVILGSPRAVPQIDTDASRDQVIGIAAHTRPRKTCRSRNR